MQWIVYFHGIFGERVLPILIVLAAIWFTVTWKAPAPDTPRTSAARIFPQLVTLQFLLGLVYWLYGIIALGQAGRYLSFPFVLHPILGLLAVLLAHWAVTNRPERNAFTRTLARLGRWSVVAMMGLLLVAVLVSTMIAYAV